MTKTNLTALNHAGCRALVGGRLGSGNIVRFVPCGSVESILFARFKVHICLLHLGGLLFLDLRVALALDAHHLVVTVAHHLLPFLYVMICEIEGKINKKSTR